MRVLVTGSSGLIGQALTAALRAGGHEVLRLVRRATKLEPDEAAWLPEKGEIDAVALEGLDAVVHLAGKNIASGRWTRARKAAIRESRVAGTTLLAETLGGLQSPPKVLVSASATGYYGDRGDAVVDESSAPGTDFLAQICQDWEAAAARAEQGGIRVVTPRIGMVLAREGGALPKLLPIFKLGLGGRLGNGRQYMSWVALDDLVSVLQRCIEDDSLRGPVNAVTPHPVTNAEFTRTVARVLHRPALFPAPGFALRALLGEMADALLLSSARVNPKCLNAAGFTFAYPELEGALRAVLGRTQV